MRQFFAKVGIVGVVVVFAVVAFSGAAVAETKKITGVNTGGKTVSQTTITLSDVPNHEILQTVGAQVTPTSSDSHWVDTRLMFYVHDDQIAGTGSHIGYATHFHKDGSESHFRFEGTHKTATKEGGAWEVTSGGTFQWVSGTGMFEDIKGGGTYTCKITAEEDRCDWAGEIEY